MAGFLVNAGAQVLCSHAGVATPTALNPRVLVSGQNTILITTPYAVAGCALSSPPANSPCVTAQWLAGSQRVTSNGQPLVVQGGLSICAPTGMPLIIAATQTRVSAI
ncbi:hypothetical protein [Methylotenera sp.]|uniref:hypothetical protein n=1 Tax=Methylotenera sp. TaxID=2051956 RepID=UPI002489BB04|nr:hypothetical protein [Methylotenera sp.]MDI1298076.1 hypothetical protein [Methylotenera sp.]